MRSPLLVEGRRLVGHPRVQGMLMRRTDLAILAAPCGEGGEGGWRLPLSKIRRGGVLDSTNASSSRAGSVLRYQMAKSEGSPPSLTETSCASTRNYPFLVVMYRLPCSRSLWRSRATGVAFGIMNEIPPGGPTLGCPTLRTYSPVLLLGRSNNTLMFKTIT